MTAEQRERLKAITAVLMEQQEQLEAFTVDCPEALDAFEALDRCTDEMYALWSDEDLSAPEEGARRIGQPDTCAFCRNMGHACIDHDPDVVSIERVSL